MSSSSIAVDSLGALYWAYSDAATGTVTVKKLETGGWTTLESGLISSWCSIAVDLNDAPYLAINDATNSATVLTFDGRRWNVVGLLLNSGTAVSFALSPSNGTPYLALSGPFYAITVKRFDGSGWEAVGAPGFVAGVRSKLAVSGSGKPYLLIGDYAAGQAPTVMTFDSASWAIVGQRGIISATSNWNALVINSRGIPYVHFSNGGDWVGNMFVEAFDGSQWADVVDNWAPGGFGGTLASGPDDALYLAFSDIGPEDDPVVVWMLPGPPPPPPR